MLRPLLAAINNGGCGRKKKSEFLVKNKNSLPLSVWLCVGKNVIIDGS
jgi:hypothetical protein